MAGRFIGRRVRVGRGPRRLPGIVCVAALAVSGRAAAQAAPSATEVRTIGCSSCDGPVAFGEIADLALRADGTLYVLDHDDTVFDVFGADGVFIGEVRVPERIGRFALARGLLAGVIFEEDGTPRVSIYAVAG